MGGSWLVQEAAPRPRPDRAAWSSLLHRVFGVDGFACPTCRGPMVLHLSPACASEPDCLDRVYVHTESALRLYEQANVPARATALFEVTEGAMLEDPRMP
jgi:hypothetical protein